MYLAENGIIPPKEWYHDPTMENKKHKRVADYLRSNHIEIP